MSGYIKSLPTRPRQAFAVKHSGSTPIIISEHGCGNSKEVSSNRYHCVHVYVEKLIWNWLGNVDIMLFRFGSNRMDFWWHQSKNCNLRSSMNFLPTSWPKATSSFQLRNRVTPSPQRNNKVKWRLTSFAACWNTLNRLEAWKAEPMELLSVWSTRTHGRHERQSPCP